MDPNTLANIRAVTVIIISLFISLRTFYLYNQARTPRLLILALAMLMIALTTTADTIGDNLHGFHLNSYWFNYFGQDTGFIVIILSLIRSEKVYLRNLIRWQVTISVLLLFLLLIGPSLPATFPNLGVIRAILSSSRGVFCLIIFFIYVSAFFTKETLFSFLMAAAFLLLSSGYIVAVPRYVLPHQDLVQNAGDIIRIFGFTTILLAVLRG
jgi:hypothetical protein